MPEFESTKQILGPVEDEPPRNTCAFHPLCNKVFKSGRECPALALPDEHYCGHHLPRAGNVPLKPSYPIAINPGVCHGITTKKKKACKTTGFHPEQPDRKWFCDAHKDQDEGNVDDDDVEPVNDIGIEEEADDEEEVELEILVQHGWFELQCDGEFETVEEMPHKLPSTRPGYCHGTTNKGKPCGTKGSDANVNQAWYCLNHASQERTVSTKQKVVHRCTVVGLVPSGTIKYYCQLHEDQVINEASVLPAEPEPVVAEVNESSSDSDTSDDEIDLAVVKPPASDEPVADKDFEPRAGRLAMKVVTACNVNDQFCFFCLVNSS
jgi:hypothetical protein